MNFLCKCFSVFIITTCYQNLLNVRVKADELTLLESKKNYTQLGYSRSPGNPENSLQQQLSCYRCNGKDCETLTIEKLSKCDKNTTDDRCYTYIKQSMMFFFQAFSNLFSPRFF